MLERYGPWAVIAGASRGIGEAFAGECAAAGLNVVLIARGEEKLRELSRELKKEYSVQTLVLSLDLSSEDLTRVLEEKSADLDVGLLVYNATFPAPGAFAETPLEDHMKLLNTNCRGQLLLIHYFIKRFSRRERSGIILMSSMGGFQGAPYLAHYGASKAFTLTLGEGLWYEYRKRGIDVLTCCPGAVDTLNFRESLKGAPPPAFPPILSPRKVAGESLRNLGKRPLIVPGKISNAVSFLMRRIFSRKRAVEIFGKETERLF